MGLTNEVFDIIKIFVKNIANNENIKTLDENGEYEVGGCKYLFGQFLRQYYVSKSHHFITVKAKEKWEKLTDENILDCSYRKLVKCKFDGKEYRYVGGNNKPEEVVLNNGGEFCYRDIFHDEHIVAITDIINEFIRLEHNNQLNDTTIRETLDKIYICKMLKEEDRKIKPKYGRGLDYEYIINNIYLNSGIEIYNWKYPVINYQITNIPKKNIISTKENKKINCTFTIKYGIVPKNADRVKIYQGTYDLLIYNNNDECVGVVWEHLDKRCLDADKQAEIYFYEEFKNNYGTWHRMNNEKQRIMYEQLKKEIEDNNDYRYVCYIKSK